MVPPTPPVVPPTPPVVPPVTPVDSVTPVGPVGPITTNPVGPVGPGPVGPVGPVGPIGTGPVGPVGPGGPGGGGSGGGNGGGTGPGTGPGDGPGTGGTVPDIKIPAVSAPRPSGTAGKSPAFTDSEVTYLGLSKPGEYKPVTYQGISSVMPSKNIPFPLMGAQQPAASAPVDNSWINMLNPQMPTDPNAAGYFDFANLGFATGGDVYSRDAMNPMGGAPASQYGIAALMRGGLTKNKPVEGYLDGPGDGMSDSIKATIDGQQPARLADGEFVIPADVVSHLGNGSSKAGAKVLYAMMDRIRHARTGNPKQGKEINPKKFLPV